MIMLKMLENKSHVSGLETIKQVYKQEEHESKELRHRLPKLKAHSLSHTIGHGPHIYYNRKLGKLQLMGG